MKSVYRLRAVSPLFLAISLFVAVAPALAKSPRPPPAPTCTLSANPATIVVGSSTTLTFSSKNATGGTIDQGVGAVGVSGTRVASPAATVVYTGTFSGAGGTATCSTVVTVTQPPPEIFILAYTTSYSYWDNTPPGSTAISHPVLHRGAGGIGTYADPITLAVGHSIINRKDILDYPAGTRFYIPNVRRYFIVEDTCGDGSQPQNGPCHIGYPEGTTAWVDMWIDGRSGTQEDVDACARFLTDTNGVAHLIIQNPAANYVVVPGPIFQGGNCTAQFGNEVVVTQ